MTHASCRTSQPASAGFSASCSAPGRRCRRRQAHEFVLAARPEGATSDGGHRCGSSWHVADARRATPEPTCCSRPAYTGPARAAVSDGGRHPRRVVRRPSRMVRLARRGCAAARPSRLAARAATRVVTISRVLEARDRRAPRHRRRQDRGRLPGVHHGRAPDAGRQRDRIRRQRASTCPLRRLDLQSPPRSGADRRLRAARRSRSPDVRLDIVGDNRTSPRVDLEAGHRPTGLGDRVRIRSYVPDDELRGALCGRVGVRVPVRLRGLRPDAARSAGGRVPVLLLDTPVAREIFGDAACYVARPDPDLIANAPRRRILFDAAERERMLDAGRRVLARYSWSECANRMLRSWSSGICRTHAIRGAMTDRCTCRGCRSSSSPTTRAATSTTASTRSPSTARDRSRDRRRRQRIDRRHRCPRSVTRGGGSASSMPERNLGFAAREQSRHPADAGELILLLNPDTTVPGGRHRALVAVLEARPDVAIAGPRLVDGDGRAELSFGRDDLAAGRAPAEAARARQRPRAGPVAAYVESDDADGHRRSTG